MKKIHTVDFFAKKKVKEPVPVSFVTKDGRRVTFGAHKIVKEITEVKFVAKK